MLETARWAFGDAAIRHQPRAAGRRSKAQPVPMVWEQPDKRERRQEENTNTLTHGFPSKLAKRGPQIARRAKIGRLWLAMQLNSGVPAMTVKDLVTIIAQNSLIMQPDGVPASP